MRMLLMGPPGAGKGTQAVRLSAMLSVPQISTGDIFRANVSEGTELGKTAQSYMDAGEYVPDEVTNAMVRDRLNQDDARRGFLLDGYPRTLDQVRTLDDILAEQHGELDAVLELSVDSEELIGRLLKRAQESGRADDTEDVIRHRQEVYVEQTAPLVATYEQRGLLVRVDGMGDVDEVGVRITAALAERGITAPSETAVSDEGA
ncbi:adenylate kinase [Solicola gregarius]|uniref:Adenylate kinase n=1 Tax=Solicola gregarius TaxID=2908642 RepID=A0AA46TF81_9ACTN|nr:adenylate kinase [Solicola gregarius]UYM03769.1 adenylate kinase [Solicola gregarius]